MNLTKAEEKALRSHPLFMGTSLFQSENSMQENGCFAESFAPNAIIHSPEQTEKRIGILLSGTATVSTPDPVRRTLMRELASRDVFGIANLFTDQPFVSVIRAKSTCRVFLIPESAVRQFLETDRTFLYRYLNFLSGRVCFLNQKIGYLTAGSTERRLALYLLSLGENPVKLPVSVSALSDLLDAGRASLYRTFDKLTADGFLIKDGKTFRITDPDAMLKRYQS